MFGVKITEVFNFAINFVFLAFVFFFFG